MEKNIISGLEENALKLIDLDLIKGNPNHSSWILSVIETLCKSISCVDRRNYAKLSAYYDKRLSSRILIDPNYSGNISKNSALMNYYDTFISGTFDEKIVLAIINLLVFAIENDIQIDKIINLYLENENIKKSRS